MFLLVGIGLAELGNVVAEVNDSQFSPKGNICCGYKFCCLETRNVFASSQKHFCFPDTNLGSNTMKMMLASFQYCWSKHTTIADGEAKAEEIQAGHRNRKGREERKERNWRVEEIELLIT